MGRFKALSASGNHLKVAITGGHGRLGQAAIRELLTYGHEVLAIDIAEPPKKPCPWKAVDLRDLKFLLRAIEDCEGFVHLARVRFPYTEVGFDPAARAWNAPDTVGDAERFADNVAMTYNVLAVASSLGARQVVSGSSLAIYGLYYPVRPLRPEYLPIDETHPLRPQDPYGISKLVGEKLCDAFAQKSDMRIASLRFAGIATETLYPVLTERRKDPLCRGTGALWSYIDVRDAASACRLALEADFRGHEAFNICAPLTMMASPTDELIKKYLPEVKRIQHGLRGRWCGYDTKKAERVLRFQAQHLIEG